MTIECARCGSALFIRAAVFCLAIFTVLEASVAQTADPIAIGQALADPREKANQDAGAQALTGVDSTPPRVVGTLPNPQEFTVGNLGLGGVVVEFDETVNFGTASAVAWTVSGTPVVIASVTPIEGTSQYAVLFAEPVRDDILTLVLDHTIVDAAGNQLDGEVQQPGLAAFPSGNGIRGGQTVIQFRILQGDADRSGIVDTTDGDIVAASLGARPSDPAWDARADLNGDGIVNVLDVAIYSAAVGRTLPMPDGVSPAVAALDPDPDAGLTDELAQLRVAFTEPIDRARYFGPGAVHVISAAGDFITPAASVLADDGLSATLSFDPPLPQCGVYRVNITNALADASGSTFARPDQAPEFTGFKPPVPPSINGYPSMVASAILAVTGTAPNAATIEVSGPGGQSAATVDPDGSFTVDLPLVINRANQLFVTSISPCGVRGLPASVNVTVDAQAPSLFIDFPSDGGTTTNPRTDVAGRVADMLSGFMGLTVTVNGQPATVDIGIGTNGTFVLPQLELNPTGPTVITATAQDLLGNTTTRTITISKVEIPPEAVRMMLLSGNGQQGTIDSLLPEPVVIRMSRPDGSPFPNKVVNFEVTRSNGRLSTTPNGAGGSMMLQVQSDSQGLARAYWKLGSEAGCGNNRLSVTSRDIAGNIDLCASAHPGTADQINIGSGNNQKAETDGPLAAPLRAWVSDGCNPAANVPVTFTVTRGGGKVNGQDVITVNTGQTGHAVVDLVLGPEPGINEVVANFEGNPTGPATFIAYGLRRDPLMPTSFSGLIFDNASQPIGGAMCTLIINGQQIGQTSSNDQGQFRFDNIPAAGDTDLFINGLKATHLNGRPIEVGSFPEMHYEISTIPNAENSLPMPVLLPMLNPANARPYSTTEETILTVEGVEGLKMTIAPGSMRLATGQPAPNGTIIALNQVHHDKVPMPMPDGASPPFAWTLQPAGAHFDPPIRIEYPNMSFLPPGAIANFLSFNHDTGKFEIICSGHVTDDGSTIVSDAGTGLSIAGWGCNCPPYSVTAKCLACEPTENGCGSEQPTSILGIDFDDTLWVPDVWIIPLVPPCIVFVGSSCNAHDRCYQMCGVSKSDCDLQFLVSLLARCAISCRGGHSVPACAALALAYYGAVATQGEDSFDAAQRELEENMCCMSMRSKLTTRDESMRALVQATLGVTLPEDIDGDFLADEWEIENGLSPKDPLDGYFDYDNDGLTNYFELFAGTNPYLFDTDNDGVSDYDHYVSFQPLRPIVPDDSWTVQVAGQSVQLTSTGKAQVTNVSAPDMFGTGGPGTAPDFLSDDFYRMTGNAVVNGTTYYAFSNKFQIQQGLPLDIGPLFVTTSPTLTPDRITISSQIIVFEIGDRQQVIVDAILGNGETRDITSRSECTTYRTSNPEVVTLGENGLVTAHGLGTAFVTAHNDGVVGVKRFDVVEDAVDTTVEGFIKRADGSSVAGAMVTTTSVFGGSGMTDANGRFSFNLVVPAGIKLNAFARTVIDGRVFVGVSGAVRSITSGITDAGIFTLREVSSGPPFGAAPTTLTVGTAPVGIASGDLEPDGDADLVTANRSSDNLSLLKNMGAGTFSAATALPAGNGPFSVVFADLDGDGDQDIAAANVNSDNVTILRNDAGVYALAATLPVGDAPRSIIAADLDGDMDLDLATANDNGNSVSLLFRTTGLMFAPAASVPVGEGPESLAAADLDGDGDVDLVVANTSGNSLTVLLNQGSGGMYTGVLYPNVGQGPRAVAMDDLDGDGDVDVALVFTFDRRLTILRNNGAGMLLNASSRVTLEEPRSIVVGDTDGDDDSDIAVVSTALDGIAVYANTGSGSFSEPSVFSASNAPEAITLTDANGDGRLDLAVAARAINSAKIVRNDGTGQFGNDQLLRVGQSPSAAAFGDLDNDGDRDVVVVNTDDGTATILTNVDGVMKAGTPFPAGVQPSDVTVADTNSDGRLDIVIGSAVGTVSVIRQRETGGFMPIMTMPAGVNITSIAVADVNADQIADIVFADGDAGAVYSLPGTDDGDYGAPVLLLTVPTPESLIAEPLNSDDRADIAVTSSSTDRLWVMLSTPTGFAPAVSYVTGVDPQGLAAADIDADGEIDLITANRGSGNVTLFLNTSGGFPTQFPFPTGAEPIDVAVGDLDFDADEDILIVSQSFDRVGILLNNAGVFAAPTFYPTGERPVGLLVSDIDGDADVDAVTVNSGSGTVSFLSSKVLLADAEDRQIAGATVYEPGYVLLGTIVADRSRPRDPIAPNPRPDDQFVSVPGGVGPLPEVVVRASSVQVIESPVPLERLEGALRALRDGRAPANEFFAALSDFTEQLDAQSALAQQPEHIQLDDKRQNAAGGSVKTYAAPDGALKSSLFIPAQSPIDLGSLGGRTTRAEALSDRWMVVGWSESEQGQYRAFISTSGAPVREFMSVEASASAAFDIDSRGAIVGAISVADNEAAGYFWTPRTGRVALSDILPPESDLVVTAGVRFEKAGSILAIARRGESLQFVRLIVPGIVDSRDVNGDGELSPADLIEFFNVQHDGSSRGDLNLDGVVDSSDLRELVESVGAGR